MEEPKKDVDDSGDEEEETKTTRKKHKAKSGLSQENNANMANEGSDEFEFLRLVEIGDPNQVARFMQGKPNLNINCTDQLGRDALRLCLEDENLELTQYLLDLVEYASIYEGLLVSLDCGSDDISLAILRHPRYGGKQARDVGKPKHQETSQFSSFMTPLILAAQKNRFEVVKHLINKGELIETPHSMKCTCKDCRILEKTDGLQFAKARLDTFRGLSSEAYIALQAHDPILTAFELRQNIKQIGRIEKHFAAEYEELEDKLSAFVVDVLDKVRGDEELDFILNKEEDDQSDHETEDDRPTLARLELAIDYKEKKFVAHSNCQKRLSAIWYDNRKFYANAPLPMKLLFILLLTICYPVLAVIYWILPYSRVGKFLRTPFVKFLGQQISFLVFLCLVVAFSYMESPFTTEPIKVTSSAMENHQAAMKRHHDKFSANLTGVESLFVTQFQRRYLPTFMQLLLCLWILGLWWQETKQLYSEGLGGYFSSMYNYVDTLSMCLYVTSFTLRYVAYSKTFQAVQYFGEHDNWYNLLKGTPEAKEHVYWMVADRFYWETADPHNVAEGLFALANVCSFMRVLNILSANEHLGPLQISIEKMTKDVVRFFVIYIIIVFAFIVGLLNLYWYYNVDIRQAMEITKLHEIHDTNAEHAFAGTEDTLRTMYFSMFGMVDLDSVELNDDYRTSLFTQRAGYVLYALYNFITVVILLNMLIAMMSRSFEIIQEEADMEWKFSRSALYMDFLKPGTTLPVPLNLVPSPKSIMNILFPWCRQLRQTVRKRSHEQRARQQKNELYQNQNMHINGQEDPNNPKPPKSDPKPSKKKGNDSDTPKKMSVMKEQAMLARQKLQQASDLSYDIVIRRVIQRFILDKQQEQASQDDDQREELRQELTNFRRKIIKDVKESIGMAVEDLTQQTKSNALDENVLIQRFNTCLVDKETLISDRLKESVPDILDQARSFMLTDDTQTDPVCVFSTEQEEQRDEARLQQEQIIEQLKEHALKLQQQLQALYDYQQAQQQGPAPGAYHQAPPSIPPDQFPPPPEIPANPSADRSAFAPLATPIESLSPTISSLTSSNTEETSSYPPSLIQETGDESDNSTTVSANTRSSGGASQVTSGSDVTLSPLVRAAAPDDTRSKDRRSSLEELRDGTVRGSIGYFEDLSK